MKRTLKRECKGLEIAKREADETSSGAPRWGVPVSASFRGGVNRAGEGLAATIRMSAYLAPALYAAPERGESRKKMLTKWSYPTRLETRTKESNIYASSRVSNPWAK